MAGKLAPTPPSSAVTQFGLSHILWHETLIQSFNTLATGYGDFRVYVGVDGRGGWFCCLLAFVVIQP